MSLTRKIAHNTAYQTIGKVLSTIIGLITVGLMTRYLGQEGYGQYGIVMAFLQFFAIFIDMGLYLIVVKYISEPEANTDYIISNIFTLRLVTSILFLGVSPIIVLFFPYPAIIKWGVALTSFSFLFVTLNQVFQGIFQKHFVTYKSAIAENFGRVALLVSVILVMYFKGGILAILSAVVIGSFINFLFTFIMAKKYTKIQLAFDWIFWKKVLKDTWPVAVSIMFNLVYFKADSIILSIVKPTADVGIYTATYKVLEVLTTFPAMFAGLLTPLLTYAYVSGDMEKFKKYLQQGFNFLVLVSVPMIVGTFFLGKDIMIVVSGSEFAIAGDVLRIIIFATAAIFIGNLFGNTVVVIHKQKAMIKAYAAVALIAVVGYLIFIPKFSYFGAASMTVFAEGCIMISAMYMVLHTTKIKLSYMIILKSVAASLVMGTMLYVLRNVYVIVLLILSVPVYALALYAFKGFSKEMVKDILIKSQ